MTAKRGALPTLTEVVEVIEVADRLQPLDGALAELPPESLPIELPSARVVGLGEDLAASVLAALRPHIEARLKERLPEAPAAERSLLAEDTLRRMRAALAGAVQACLAQAIDEALAQRRRA